MADVIPFPRRSPGEPRGQRDPRVVVERRPLLWREAAGHELRRERIEQHRTQGEVAVTAGISVQYLSEVERGRKEPSSEIVQAVAGALGLGLAELARRVAEVAELTSLSSTQPGGASSLRPDGPVLLAV
jgi:DNA-binding XRE family transcriptional regulator